MNKHIKLIAHAAYIAAASQSLDPGQIITSAKDYTSNLDADLDVITIMPLMAKKILFIAAEFLNSHGAYKNGYCSWISGYIHYAKEGCNASYLSFNTPNLTNMTVGQCDDSTLELSRSIKKVMEDYEFEGYVKFKKSEAEGKLFTVSVSFESNQFKLIY